MSLEVIGFGVGRTGTFSLKQALEQLGFGPCHHMEEVDPRSAEQIAVWKDAATTAETDWRKAYAGYRAAVDWPTAAFCTELTSAFPDAKYILTVRDPQRWYRSFSDTIAPLVSSAELPEDMQPFVEMVVAVMAKTGFDLPAEKEAVLDAFDRHTARVKATVPAGQLLVFNVAEGWEPLCNHLGVAVPDMPFPRTNSTEDFWKSAADDVAAT